MVISCSNDSIEKGFNSIANFRQLSQFLSLFSSLLPYFDQFSLPNTCIGHTSTCIRVQRV